MRIRRALVVATVAASWFSSPLASQTTEKRIVVGPMAGVSISTISGDDVGDSPFLGSRTGFVGGGFISFNANTHVAIEPQLLYAQKGARFSDGFSSAVWALDYIEIPLLIKGRYWFGAEARPVTLNVFGGPAIAFNVHCELSSTDFSSPCGDDTMKTAEFSVLFGAGAEYFGFSLQGRYDMSVTNAFSSGPSGEIYAKNRSWMVTLGYMIPVR